ncbi:MAG TPA: hypothetical protein VHB98_05235 [Chloroflexota bacterium]|nr:hypothetical protein [Chloroflexota bacterium]
MTRLWRMGALGVLMVSLTLARCAAPSHATGTPTSVLAMLPATKVIVFHPAGTGGAAVSGSCAMGESLALNRTDAWRCIVGNEIYDPCFSAVPHATSVICGATPAKPIGIKVRLSKALPTHAPVRSTQPWILGIGDGSLCTMDTGATFGVKGQRANYACSDQDWVIGYPTTGRVWYAVKASLSSKASPTGPMPSHLFAVSVATVWE